MSSRGSGNLRERCPQKYARCLAATLPHVRFCQRPNPAAAGEPLAAHGTQNNQSTWVPTLAWMMILRGTPSG